MSLCRSRTRGEAAREEIGAGLDGRFLQTDTYFHIRPGRLKLRHMRPDPSGRGGAGPERYELISYRRWNRPQAMDSHYHILPITDGPRTRAFFAAALGVKVQVEKTRTVYLKDNLRIHLDTVAELGTFLEFEVIVTPDQSVAACRARLPILMQFFGISRNELLLTSYSDLLLGQKGA